MDGSSSSQLVAALMQTMALKLLPWSPPAAMAFPFLQTRRGSGNAQHAPGPVFDVALQMANDPLRFLEDLSSQYGSIVEFRLLTRPVILVADP